MRCSGDRYLHVGEHNTVGLYMSDRQSMLEFIEKGLNEKDLWDSLPERLRTLPPKWAENFTGIPPVCTDEVKSFVLQFVAFLLATFCGLILAGVFYFFSKWYAERLISFLYGISRSVFLVVISVVLVVLFMNPPTTTPKRSKECFQETIKSHQPLSNIAIRLASKDELSDKLFELEVKKVFDELQARIGHIDSWYHWKFALVGSVIAFIMGFRGLKKPLHLTINSPAVPLLLASACVIAFAADIHMRIESAMTGMLGRWISEYVEPSRASFEPPYWETYLRTGRSLHTSAITQLTFIPHLHFLTWPIYISYMWVFQEMALQGRTENTALIKESFLLVQFSLLIFVFVAHSTPIAYGLMLFKIVQPGYLFALFIFLWFVICALSAPYFAIAGRKATTTDFRNDDTLNLRYSSESQTIKSLPFHVDRKGRPVGKLSNHEGISEENFKL